ncbi:uncharacterized protein LOC117239317 [Bombus vosnesenskii]|uniref:Uncharacterized protein LOC117239317 n=1 Tax=Bombus vosnesenskii TaxID=207650 RepID=A0A6J3L604_9HYME|nr:uncharacterized protein LOC117239317 [Bombus vosnesenskii]
MRGVSGDGLRAIGAGKRRNASGRDAHSEKVPGLPRPPGCAVVSLTVRDGSGFTYRNTMSVVKREVDITELRPRSAITGALLFEIPGQDARSKASRLAERMAATLKDLPAKVTVRRRTAELRVTGLEDSVTPEEVAAAVAEAGDCQADKVNVGVIRSAPGGLESVWLRCPLTAARKISRGRSAWSRVTCAGIAHRRPTGALVPMCPVCADLGMPASHHMGSPACKPPARKRRTAQEAKTISGNSGDAAKRKETIPLSTDPMRDRREDREGGHNDGEGNGPEEAMETDLSGRRGGGQPPLQRNLNRSRRAQDLMFQSLTERRIALAAVAEPYSILDASRDAEDLIGSVAVFWTGIAGSPSCSVIERARGFVAVKWGDLAVVAVYVSPNISRTEYASSLDGLGACTRRLGACPSLVLGSFNAHSTAWGTRRTNGRGRDVQDWAAALDLRLMNRGSSSTCVAWRGESIVDFIWANPAASRRVSGWGVSPELTLSFHLYIFMEAAVGGVMGDRSLGARGLISPPERRRRFPRWAVTRRHEDFMAAAAIAVAWLEKSRADEDAEAGATRLRRDMHAICDSCMPRSRRRRRVDEDTVARLYEAYSEARRLLQRAIKEAKRRAWGELLASLDSDPWGRPYKLVLNKLRPWAPPLTESMDPRFLDKVVSTVFPGAANEGDGSPTEEEEQEPQPPEEEPRVSAGR